MSLTLPIVVGKKYVRRDGAVVITSAPVRYYEQMSEGPFVCVAQYPEDKESGRYNAFASTGRILPGVYSDHQQDLVADYIEPANGHPHAALMAQFAEDAKETATPWDRWEMQDCNGDWLEMSLPPKWSITAQYRRRPAPTPDPHAESAATYAKDMAQTDKAWKRWEQKDCAKCDWRPLIAHPLWYADSQYRRKASA